MQNKRIDIFHIISYALISMLCIVIVYPLMHVVAISLSDEMSIIRAEVNLIPKNINFEYYKTIFSYPDVPVGYKNTIIYVTVGVTINMIMTTMGAYVLSRKEFYLRRFFSLIIVFTMLFSGGLIPTYIVVSSLGLLNSVWAIVLPMAINTFNLIILRTFFESIPVSLTEASKLDGCNQVQTMLYVVLPSSMTGLMTIGLFYLVEHWNSFFPAMIYLSDRSKYPMQLVLRRIVIENNSFSQQMESSPGFSDGVKYAVILITVLPVLLFYPFVQKYFTKGVMIGAIKG